MSVKRFIFFTPPIAHINGKMAGSDCIIHNKPDTSESDVSFYYGYKRSTSKKNKSLFALRERARNLSVNPYTNNENSNKRQFSDAVALAVETMRDPALRQAALTDFLAQKKYTSFWGFVVASHRLSL